MDFFDIRDLWRIGKRHKINLGLWLVAVIALTLYLFILKYTDGEWSVYMPCIFASLAFFVAELAWIFLHSNRQITPLILFLLAFYLVRNSQFLLVLFGVPFDVHHLVLLKEHLRDAIVLTSVGNIWAGFAGIVATVPHLEMGQLRVAVQDNCDEKNLFRFLGIGVLLTGGVAYVLAVLRFSRFLTGGMELSTGFNDRIPQVVGWMENLFVPFGFAMVAFFQKKRTGAVVIASLFGYFLLTMLCKSLPLGVAGLFALLFLICLMPQESYRPAHSIGLFAVISILLLILSWIVTQIRNPEDLGNLSLRSLAVNAFSGIGYGCFALLAALRIVPASEPFLYGREYAEALLSGLLPSAPDQNGILGKLTADTRIYEVWQERYFGEVTGTVGFSPDAEAYLNFGCYGFLMIFLFCMVIAFFLNRYHWYDRSSRFPKYVACVLLYACMSFPGRDGSSILRMLVWGVILMALATRLCVRRNPEPV